MAMKLLGSSVAALALAACASGDTAPNCSSSASANYQQQEIDASLDDAVEGEDPPGLSTS